MTTLILCFEIGEWGVIISAFQTVIVLIGIVVAILNLKAISNSNKLGVILKFSEDLVKYEDDRKFLYKNFSFDEHVNLSEEEEKKVNNVINSLNRISLLIDNKVLNSEHVFSLCHTMIIRCEHILSHYIIYKEQKIGGRYGRRIKRLSERAKQYHDCNTHHRVHPIKLDNGNKSEEIYRTKHQSTFLTMPAQKLEWYLRKKFKHY